MRRGHIGVAVWPLFRYRNHVFKLPIDTYWQLAKVANTVVVCENLVSIYFLNPQLGKLGSTF